MILAKKNLKLCDLQEYCYVCVQRIIPQMFNLGIEGLRGSIT